MAPYKDRGLAWIGRDASRRGKRWDAARPKFWKLLWISGAAAGFDSRADHDGAPRHGPARPRGPVRPGGAALPSLTARRAARLYVTASSERRDLANAAAHGSLAGGVTRPRPPGGNARPLYPNNPCSLCRFAARPLPIFIHSTDGGRDWNQGSRKNKFPGDAASTSSISGSRRE